MRKKKRDLATVGRGLVERQESENVSVVSEFTIGEAVQYYLEGWRFGHIVEIPSRGLRRGMVRVEHSQTGKHWVNARDLRKMGMV
jgi:hypothetical protein